MDKLKIFLSFFFVFTFVYYFYPVKKGGIIILDGVSSSGKTSLANCLMKFLDSTYKKVALDDYVADVFLAKKKLNIPHKKFISIIRECRDRMYEEIIRLTSCGKNVLLDTVLSGLEGEKDIDIAFEKLKGLEVVKILVYCPLPLVTERIEERNAKSFFDDKPEEMRSIAATLQFCNVYKVLESDDDFFIGTLSKKDIELAYKFPDFVPKQDIKIFDAVKNKLLFSFGLFDRESVKIAPRQQYDCVVDTSKCSPEECSEKIFKKYRLR